MRKEQKKIRNILVIAIIVAVCGLFGTTAWATLSFVKPEKTPAVTTIATSEIPEQVPASKKSNAPEPTSMALFGSGILGMILSSIRKAYAAVKRALDIAAGIVGVIFLSPLFLLTAILIKLTSKGPVLYTQTRVGKDGEHFRIYKFRTMKVDAEKGTGAVWARENDNRLIPCGKFLRKAHIDEIPQFFNILKGEMSLIGPRPERPEFVSQFVQDIPGYAKRLDVKPGLTGLAQVWHKYDETMEDVKKKIKYDLLYIKKACFWTDIRILLRTVRVVFTGEGAR